MMAQTEAVDLTATWGRVQAYQQLMVAAGLRSACRLRISREDLPQMAATVERLSVKMVVGNEAVVAHQVPGRAGFSEWGHREALTPTNLGDCYVYIAADHHYGQRLRRCDEGGDDATLGSLLGYPDCCVSTFAERCNSGGGDPVIAMYDDSSAIDWRMNVSLLCFGYSLLSHIPCRSDCSVSYKLADQYFKFIESIASARAAELKEVLLCWVLHTALLGIAAFKAHNRNGALHVETVSPVEKKSVLGQLLAPGSIVRRDDRGLSVDGHFITGNQAKLFEFN